MLQKLHDQVLYWDYTTWYYINTVWHTPFLNAVVPYLRNQWTWAPLYLFLLLFMTINFGKKGWIWCGFFLLTFACSDFISAHLLKPYFHRIRPCNNPAFASIVNLLVPCGGGYSFPSSHASNHFALGIFMAITLSKRIKWVWPLAILWAAAVSLSQVYVGVHFPLDVTCGAFLGIFVGSITGRVYNKNFLLSAN